MANDTQSMEASPTTATPIDWTARLLEQLTWHWEGHVRPRFEGLTDEEYLWEPVAGCWSVRPRSEAVTSMAAGLGDLVVDFALPEPVPAPVTTIAWRLAHLMVLFGERTATHFGGPPAGYQTTEWPAGAAEALNRLDGHYAAWVAGVRSLGAEALERPVGPAEGPWAEAPYADLVLHISREAIHHGAEVLLLRDLYRHRS